MIQTQEYPTRYAAFDHPREWCRYNGSTNNPLEAAVYHEPMVNARYPHITDGIYCEIRRMPDGQRVRRFLVDGQSTRPDASRAQRHLLQSVPIRYAGDENRAFDEAMGIAQRWIDAARIWITAGAA